MGRARKPGQRSYVKEDKEGTFSSVVCFHVPAKYAVNNAINNYSVTTFPLQPHFGINIRILELAFVHPIQIIL